MTSKPTPRRRRRIRTKGEGSVRPRDAAGSVWQLVYELPPLGDGKRRQGYETFRGDREAAENRLRELVGQVKAGAYVDPSKQTVKEFITSWLDDYKQPNISPRTYKGYVGIVFGSIVPYLGRLQLKAVRQQHITGMYAKLRRGEGPDGKPRHALSGTSLAHINALLANAFTTAQTWDLISKHPMRGLEAPKINESNVTILQEDDIPRFLKAIEPSRYQDVYRLIFGTGTRRSEALGITWRWVDLDGKAVTIAGGLHRIKGHQLMLLPPKSKYSRRRIAIGDSLVQMLRRLKKEHIEFCLAHGIPWSEDRYVFCRLDGAGYDPEKVTHDFADRMETAGLKGVGIHALRHTHASVLIKAGKHAKEIQERLGHGSIAITMNLYGHLMKGLAESAPEAFEGYLNGAQKG